jgi:hypothetical protein
LKEIGAETFRDSGLKSIRIPNNVEKVGDGCFCECKSLSEVIFESECKLKEIGAQTFRDCPLKCVKMEEGSNIEYIWPIKCRIEYIPRSNDDERE